MTLLLTFVCDSHVILVSDRRVTWLRDGRLVHKDDMRNKAILYCSRIVIQYTGAADIGGTMTDDWLAGELADCITMNRFVAELPTRLEATFREHVEMRRRPLAVVIAGWGLFSHGVSAFTRVVANFDVGTRQLHATDGALFLHSQCEPPSGTISLISNGVAMTAEHRHALQRNLLEVAKRQVGLGTLVRLLTDAVRDVAASKSSVGRGLMVTVLPRSAVKSDDASHLALYGIGADETPQFAYLPAEQGELVGYGPHFVCGGGMVTGFEIRPIIDVDRSPTTEEMEEWRQRLGPQFAYLVKVREGITADGPTRDPDVPKGTPFMASYHGNDVLVFTPNELPPPARRLGIVEIEGLRESWGQDLQPTDNFPFITEP